MAFYVLCSFTLLFTNDYFQRQREVYIVVPLYMKI